MEDWRELEAASRLKLIAPLLDENLDEAAIVARKKEIVEDSGLSYRTIGCYYAAFKEKGYEGLKPSPGTARNTAELPENYDEIITQAIALRVELPGRSIPQIIKILELENLAKPGEIKRSTLQRHMQKEGYSARQMRIYEQKGKSARRFKKEHRCVLWQADIKFGPYVTDPKTGEVYQTYLSVFIDNATRYVVGARFYDNQTTEAIEDSLRRAVMQFGKPLSLQCDNGKPYRSNTLRRACNVLGIRLIFCKPYSPEAKGAVERFNQTVDSFLAEFSLLPASERTLEKLNNTFEAWLNQYYHTKPHAGLSNISPATAFRTDSRALELVSSEKLAEAFLHIEKRDVDKVGCMSFKGKTYEVGMQFCGKTVEVVFDPLYIADVEIRCEGYKPFTVKQRVIGEDCDFKKSFVPSPASGVNGSRLLNALNEKNISGRTKLRRAVSYGDDSDV
jgi:transposase InsO family protein